MNFEYIDKILNKVADAIGDVCNGLYTRDEINRKFRKSRIVKKVLKKKTNIYKGKRILTRIKRFFAVCHPDELHFALGLCRKCYWKQYRDNAPPSICHPNKKTFRKGLCKPCYRKLHPEKKRRDNG